MNKHSTFPPNDHRNYNVEGKAFDIGEHFYGVPLDKGLLAVEALKKILPNDYSLTELSLKWILMHPEVSVVIPGAKTSDQVLKNIQASEKSSIEILMKKIHDHEEKSMKSSLSNHVKIS